MKIHEAKTGRMEGADEFYSNSGRLRYLTRNDEFGWASPNQLTEQN